MATVDQRIVSGDATVKAIENAVATHGLTAGTDTIQDLISAIEAAIQTEAAALTPAQDAETCVECGGTGEVEAIQDTMPDPEDDTARTLRYPNETEDTVVDEEGTANPTIICPLCRGNKLTAGTYEGVNNRVGTRKTV